MKNWIIALMAAVLCLGITACGPKKQQVRPNYEQVRENGQQAGQDLQREEDKKKQQQEGEDQ